MSNVAIREAILRAADHIEANPGEFNFETASIPACGSPGCALGWIGHFYGADRLEALPDPFHNGVLRVLPVLGLSPYTEDGLGGWLYNEFYDRMNAFAVDWKVCAAACASALRLYADKYHPTDATPAIESGTWSALAGIWQPKVQA